MVGAADCEDAIKIDRREGWSHYCRATLESRAGDLDKAPRDIVMAVDLDASHAEFYSLRGLIFSGKDDLDAAMADYDKAGQFSPSGALNYARRGLLNEGNAELARADFKRALDRSPAAAFQLWLGSWQRGLLLRQCQPGGTLGTRDFRPA